MGPAPPHTGGLAPPARHSTLLGARSLCPSHWAWGQRPGPRPPHQRQAPLDVGERGLLAGKSGPRGCAPGLRHVQPRGSSGLGSCPPPSLAVPSQTSGLTPGCRGHAPLPAVRQPREEGAGPVGRCGGTVGPVVCALPGRLRGDRSRASARPPLGRGLHRVCGSGSLQPSPAGSRRHLAAGGGRGSWHLLESSRDSCGTEVACKRDSPVALGAFAALCGHHLRPGFPTRLKARGSRAPPPCGVPVCGAAVGTFRPQEGLDTRPRVFLPPTDAVCLCLCSSRLQVHPEH